MELIGIESSSRRSLQDVILDQVRLQQRGAASVERFKDHESVVSGCQVDHHHFEQPEHRRLKTMGALLLLRVIDASADPLSDLESEEVVCLDDQRIFVASGRSAVLHRRFKRAPIQARRPQLEFLVAVDTAVEHQARDPLGLTRRSELFEDLLCCVQQDLGRRQSLLSIDDQTGLDLGGSRQLLLKYHRPHEVLASAFLGLRAAPSQVRQFFEIALGRIPNIVPERFPLFVLVPHVGPLKCWDDVSDVLLEEALQRQGVCLHRTSLRCRRSDSRRSAAALVKVWASNSFAGSSCSGCFRSGTAQSATLPRVSIRPRCASTCHRSSGL